MKLKPIIYVALCTALLAAGCGKKPAVKTSGKQSQKQQEMTPEQIDQALGVPQGWTRYARKDLGYSFIYPQWWYMHQPKDETRILIGNKPDASLEGSDAVFLELSWHKFQIGESAASVATRIAQSVDKKAKEPLLGTTRGGETYARVDFLTKDKKAGVVYAAGTRPGEYVFVMVGGNSKDTMVESIVKNIVAVYPAAAGK